MSKENNFKKGHKVIITGNGDNRDPNASWIIHGFYLGELVEILERYPENDPIKYLCKGKKWTHVVHASHLLDSQ